MNIKLQAVGLALLGLFTLGCNAQNKKTAKFDINKQLEYCAVQASKTLKDLPDDGKSLPRTIATGSKQWKFITYGDWTSGFWPGELWYLYEFTKDEQWKKEADKYTRYLAPLTTTKFDHDLGFQVFNSYGNGYRLTKNPEYKVRILQTADSLATLFNPKVGTILSWPYNKGYGGHNTIIDNMMNLELLFWASKNGGDKHLYDIAVKHAETTMQNHFRPDYSAYHVVVYDPETGKVIKKVTAQGYADDSMWARGQTWAIYGFTMVYQETKDPKFLDFVHKVARVYLDRLPKDLIPYWDFNAPDIPNAPRDASAAAIVSSALIELSGYTNDAILKKEYITKAQAMLAELSANYQSRNTNDALLLHATGHKPAESEIDCSLNYADYYYIEALTRLKNMK